MGKIRTVSGRLVDPFNPVVGDIIPATFIHSISCLNRFTGHAKYPYSVGQHTLALCRIVPEHLRRAAMIHDWQEAWFNDLASPVKAELPNYKHHERRAGEFIAGMMGVSGGELEELDDWDKRIYVNERDVMFDTIEERGMGDQLMRLDIEKHSTAYLFTEMHWLDVRRHLLLKFSGYFPEWGDPNKARE